MTGSAKGEKAIKELRERLIEEAGGMIGEMEATTLVTEFERLVRAMTAYELGTYYGTMRREADDSGADRD